MNDPLIVNLEFWEIYEAGCVGVARVCTVIRNDLKNPGAPEVKDRWEQHVSGAIGERAVAKALNQYWHGKSEPHTTADIGDIIEVKWARQHYHNLMVPVHQLEKASMQEKPYYLVTGQDGNYQVHGWMRGHKIATYETRQEPGRPEGYFVPKDDLEPPLPVPEI